MRQVVEGLQVLQPYGVLAIPDFHGTTELSHIANDALAPAHTLEFRVVFDNDLANFFIKKLKNYTTA
ncbi:MAG: hypothetical protein V7K94_29955 [Nostoc sp.]|uniref:hypothetical protein n=1 Tax=Nostoc sp. TaxID=1180 RepID=UPI002FF5B277